MTLVTKTLFFFDHPWNWKKKRFTPVKKEKPSPSLASLPRPISNSIPVSFFDFSSYKIIASKVRVDLVLLSDLLFQDLIGISQDRNHCFEVDFGDVEP